MNGFLKGFFSLFDWMLPKTLDDSINNLDDSMGTLHTKMGWGDYKNPLKYTTRSVSAEEWKTMVDKYIEDNPITEPCKPYVDYNVGGDTLHVFWDCNTDFYVEPLLENLSIELIKEFDTDRIVGVNIRNITRSIQEGI